jgi:uncharacterized BrkB/YihY/UPF0761 family membrane protein
MNYLLFCLFWIIGLAITSFTLLPILIIFVFGIPITKKLERVKLIKPNNGIVKKYFISVVILITIFTVCYQLIKSFIPNELSAFIIGGVLSIIFSIGKIGNNRDNLKDYIETNKRSFTVSEDELPVHLLRNGITYFV